MHAGLWPRRSRVQIPSFTPEEIKGLGENLTPFFFLGWG